MKKKTPITSEVGYHTW